MELPPRRSNTSFMQHRNRAILILLCLACGFTVVSFNLIQIQLVQHDKFWRMAVENHLHPETIPPRRGAFYDSEGNILAQTQRVYDIRIDGAKMKLNHPEVNLPKVAAVLGLPAQNLVDTFNPRNRYQLIAEDVDDGTAIKLRAMKLDCIIAEPHDRRFYPNNELGAHILGFVGDNGHGLAGMEKEMDKSLNGIPGERWVERDAKHNEIAGYQTSETPAVDGFDVTLTIKIAMQHVVEDALDQIVQNYQPNAAYIILMDPHNGEILAMGSRPNYDPNDRKTFKPDNIRNRCITDMVEPGSIFKIVTLAAVLNEGAVTLNTPIFCENGSFYYGGRILKDDEPNGTLPVIEAFAQSSNIAAAKLAINYLGEQKLYKYATAFGIGHTTGIFDQQGESPGLLRPVNKWSAPSISRIPMGQEVAATPIQMATAMCVIANGGKLVLPHLTKQVVDRESGKIIKTYQPTVVRQVITADAAREVARALEQVTIDGTAKKIHIDGYNFAGKTGTAQKFVNGEYSHTQFVSSFVGFMPVEDPAFVALVMVDDPKTKNYYGAEVSAPVFASLAKQLAQIMNIPPDKPIPAAPVLSSNNPPAL